MAPNAHIKLLTHTARIFATAERYRAENEGAKHPRDAEYADQLRQYRAQWAALKPAERVAAIEDAATVAKDLTQDQLAAAQAALEA